MSDRSYSAVTIENAPDPLDQTLAAILDGAQREGEEFVWEEVNLNHAEEVAVALRAARPDLAFSATQQARYEFDGYRVTATPGRALHKVTLSASGRVVIDAHAILDLLAGAATADQARSVVRAHLDAEGAL